MNRFQTILLSLIRVAFGSSPLDVLPREDDWDNVYSLALNQDVAAIAFDGIQTCYSLYPEFVKTIDSLKNKELKYNWFGSCLSAEVTYSSHKETIKKLARFYRDYGIRMMILKGFVNASLFPIPEHRVMGDIDIYLFGSGLLADSIITREYGIQVKQNEDKHSTYRFNGILIENHAGFINDIVHPSHKRLESFLERESKNAVPLIIQEDDRESVIVYSPSVLMNALFLPIHCATHFVRGESSIRQLCDWACFVKEYGSSINWNIVNEIVNEAGFSSFFHCLNGIVIRYLGVSSNLLPAIDVITELEERVINDILSRDISRKLSIFYKIQRFFNSRWKYSLVYKEPMLCTFPRQALSYIRHNNKNAVSLWEKRHMHFE